MDSILNIIKHSFGQLWKCRPRGESIEIITPMPTSTDMYVSIFITKRNDAWIVTDGGWINRGIYNCELPLEDSVYSKIYSHFMDEFNISTTDSPSGILFHYKGTRDYSLIPNIVFDLANFISSVVSCACIEYRSQHDTPVFKKTVKQFLSERLPSGTNVAYNTSLTGTKNDARFSAIISSTKGKLSLVNFVSGYSAQYFKAGIYRSSFLFDMAEFSPAKERIRNKIVLVDDSVTSFNRLRVNSIIETCKNKDQRVLTWSNDRNELLKAALL